MTSDATIDLDPPRSLYPSQRALHGQASFSQSRGWDFCRAAAGLPRDLGITGIRRVWGGRGFGRQRARRLHGRTVGFSTSRVMCATL